MEHDPSDLRGLIPLLDDTAAALSRIGIDPADYGPSAAGLVYRRRDRVRALLRSEAESSRRRGASWTEPDSPGAAAAHELPSTRSTSQQPRTLASPFLVRERSPLPRANPRSKSASPARVSGWAAVIPLGARPAVGILGVVGAPVAGRRGWERNAPWHAPRPGASAYRGRDSVSGEPHRRGEGGREAHGPRGAEEVTNLDATDSRPAIGGFLATFRQDPWGRANLDALAGWIREHPEAAAGAVRGLAELVVNPEPPADERWGRTRFLVRATVVERVALWSDYAEDGPGGLASLRWEPDPGGPRMVTAGYCGAWEVGVSLSWATVEGRLIAFWEPAGACAHELVLRGWTAWHFDRRPGRDGRLGACRAVDFDRIVDLLTRPGG